VIVLSHGHFDLLHYGHFKHLEAAYKLVGLLPGSHRFLDAGRFMTNPDTLFSRTPESRDVQALRYVDRVLICDDPGPTKPLISEPNIYVKGLNTKAFTRV